MNKEQIIEKLQETVDGMIFLIKEITINEISDKIDFVITYIEENKSIDPIDIDNSLKLLESKRYSFDEVVEIILPEEKEISWVDLFALFSDKNQTIICVTLVKINKFDEDVNFHCAVLLPPNYKEGEKFDLNQRLYEK